MKPLLIDIETLPAGAEAFRAFAGTTGASWRDLLPPGAEAELGPCPDPEPMPVVVAPSTYKDPAKIAQYIADRTPLALAKWQEANEKAAAAYLASCHDWWARGSLRPHRGSIYCLGWTVDGVAHVETGTESDMIDVLGELLREHRPSHLVAHNAQFEADFITAAAIRADRWDVASVTIAPHYGVTAQMKLYDRRPAWYCTQRAWSETRVKLEHVCQVLGIPHHDGKRDPIDGAEVLPAYMDHREGDIIAHCRADVEDEWALLEALRRLGVAR